MKKITKRNSILFKREWIEKYIEEGLKLPNHRLSHQYSLGETLEIMYPIKKEQQAKRLGLKNRK